MTRPNKILSVCPDRTLGETRRIALEEAGYDVVDVQNRLDAVLASALYRFDLVILCHTIDLKEALLLANDLTSILPETTILDLGNLQVALQRPILSPSMLLDAVERVLANKRRKKPEKSEASSANRRAS